MSFTLTVRDVFSFDDGSFILCGEVTSGPGYIAAGSYHAAVHGSSIGEVRVTGERSGGGIQGLRSIGMQGPLRLNTEAIKDLEVSFETIHDTNSECE
jgi:hypothetical protein